VRVLAERFVDNILPKAKARNRRRMMVTFRSLPAQQLRQDG